MLLYAFDILILSGEPLAWGGHVATRMRAANFGQEGYRLRHNLAAAQHVNGHVKSTKMRLNWHLALLCCTVWAETESQLKQRLVRDYGPSTIRPQVAAVESRHASDASQCPAEIEGRATPADDVRVQIYVDKYDNLDMVRQTFGVGGYLRILWNDPGLAYNGIADGGCTDELLFDRKEAAAFWQPILYFEESRKIMFPSETDEDGLATMFSVAPNGDVFWSRQFNVVMFCAMFNPSKHSNGRSPLDRLPFDVQQCPFVFGMYAEDASKVTVAWREQPNTLGFTNYMGPCLGEWTVLGVEEESQVIQYVGRNYTYASATLRFARNPEIWLWSYLVPAISVTILQYFGFYIDPMATPARVSLGMITLLVVMTNFATLIRTLPAISSQPPWLGRFLLYSFLFNVGAMLEQVSHSSAVLLTVPSALSMPPADPVPSLALYPRRRAGTCHAVPFGRCSSPSATQRRNG